MAHVGHSEVKSFCGTRVNLPKDIADKHRAQVKGLRERLEKKIADDPSFDLVKMLHAGSVAKGTALRTVNDLDVAVYVKPGSAPTEVGQLAAELYHATTQKRNHEHYSHTMGNSRAHSRSEAKKAREWASLETQLQARWDRVGVPVRARLDAEIATLGGKVGLFAKPKKRGRSGSATIPRRHVAWTGWNVK